jgi:hypothetical protein
MLSARWLSITPTVTATLLVRLVMDNKDVQSAIDNIIDFISTLWNGLEAAIDVIPPIVLGFIVVALIVVWAWHKVSS